MRSLLASLARALLIGILELVGFRWRDVDCGPRSAPQARLRSRRWLWRQVELDPDRRIDSGERLS
jgi:hypothetical protein